MGVNIAVNGQKHKPKASSHSDDDKIVFDVDSISH